MSALNWGLIQDGGVLESLMHAILYAEDPQTILFGRPGKDAGQDARTANGTIVYQSKYRDGLNMDKAVDLALEELEKIKKYRKADHSNYEHWKDAQQWVLFANFSINPNDDAKWRSEVVPEFKKEGLVADYWHKEIIEGKLAKRSEVRDVFFGQENRVLVGLKEAHDLLRNERHGNVSLDTPLLGRNTELSLVDGFANSPEKRVLPVIGPGGIGRSRFLFESLVTLSQQGWRVLWGLPGTMAKSSQWFRLLNGSQKTCVAIDDPDDPELLRTVIEQLSTVERRNWRVIVSCRTDRSQILRRYKSYPYVEEAIRLNELNEPHSKALIKNCLNKSADDAWLHRVFQFTRGNPGWLWLIADLAKREKLNQLPPKVDDIASLCVTTCLERFDGTTANHARTLLRWLALWGNLVVDAEYEERDEITFLEKAGIRKSSLCDLLKNLVETGLVRNWGIGKRLYGIDSQLIRQHILSEWLLQADNSGSYTVNPSGVDLVKKLLAGGLPRHDSTLQTISHLAISRLEEQEAYTLLRPISREMVITAEQANLVTQNYLAELVAKLGIADPENALDVLIAIRQNAKDDQEVEDSFWGKFKVTRNRLLSTLSWTLFNLAAHVDDPGVAHRFLNEFRELAQLVESGLNPSDPAKSPQLLLSRLLCESKNSDVFAQPAYEMATNNVTSEDWWPFVGVLAKCILEPMRETSEWVANWTLGFSKCAISTKSTDWTRLIELRRKLFDLQHSGQQCDRIWRLLSESHHSVHYASAHYKMTDENRQKYRALLIDDLTRCEVLLKNLCTLDDATRARPMWEWYLKHGQDEAMAAKARECERLYSDLSKWRLQDFFRFDYDEELAVETERIAAILRDATDPSVFVDFFEEVKRYLNIAQDESGDSDRFQLNALANKLADMFSLDTSGDTTALSSFAKSILAAGEEADPRSFFFATMVCRARLGQLKTTGEFNTRDWINRLLAMTPSKGTVLYQFYSNAHPRSTGQLAADEVQCVLEHKSDLNNREWFWLLGILVGAVDESLSIHVLESLKSPGLDRFEASGYLNRFIDSSHLAILRYERTPSREFAKSILDWIVKFQLDGVLLESYALTAIIELSGFIPDTRTFASLMQSRIELESAPTRDDRFTILPYRFDVIAWCKFDPTRAADVVAFEDVCRLALGNSFTASYWIPKYLPAIDSSGKHVANFVVRQLADKHIADGDALSKLAYLASNYPVDSEAWASIARPICEKARGLNRKDREHLFFSLSRKETGVMTSMPGEVPQYYVDALDSAKRLLDEEPTTSLLRAYREWALKCAEHDLRREKGRAEEDTDE